MDFVCKGLFRMRWGDFVTFSQKKSEFCLDRLSVTRPVKCHFKNGDSVIKLCF